MVPPEASCFGPWMLAKMPRRKVPKSGFSGSTKMGGFIGSKSNGSRFDILHMDSGDNEEPIGHSPSSNIEKPSATNTEHNFQQSQHNQNGPQTQSHVVGVRDPKGGKNTQQSRSNKGNQSSTVSKQVKDRGQENSKSKNKEVLSESQVNKDKTSDACPIVSNNILPVRVKPIPFRTQEQKEVDHEFALQLIKK
ncbi:hypothetical protein SESBI_16362 [Sesbania bispinosa]|nr:hypothetical protein SESBI_16362 [Sesbania bispinosa]